MEIEPEYQYEVFLSFRGPDTRLTFTDCLYRRLSAAGIHVFLDNEELRVGEEISGALLKALNKSRIYIPIFSKNFASSSWCLREIAHMVECTSRSNGKKEILPIFYDVETHDVKLVTDFYKEAILEHKEKFGSYELKRWVNALVEVARIKGWDLKGKGHGKIIEVIVEEVWCKLSSKHVDVPEHLVEDHCQLNAIIELLDVDSSGVRFIGIHGLGGIGKTTLAKVVFNKLSSHFDGVSFLNNVRESSQHGMINLQKKLLSNFVGSNVIEKIKDIGGGMELIKRVCSTRKVLIVLDDLDKEEQLKKLAGKSKWFGPGSRIIITTRDKSILMTKVESHSEDVLNQTEGILAYEVHAMEFGQALQLFYKCAFRRDSPVEGYDHLAEKIVRRVGMLPLAVEVIGSSLYCNSLVLKKHFQQIDLWEDMLNQLEEAPSEDVRDALMISYRGLQANEKEVFLDIACFFTNEDKTYPVTMWSDCKYHPRIAISVLLQRSLIKIGDDNKFWMHDQVRDLGRHIILEVYPRKLSRVWIHEDAVNLLERKEKNEDVEALSLTSDGCSRNFAPEELAALPNLRFLRVKGIDFFGNFENPILKLRWLSWQTWGTTFQANKLRFRNLVVLDLSDSNIQDGWDGWSQIKMDKLKVLDLTGCIWLRRTPDFSNFMTLEMLILTRCVKLTTIDSSIGKLKLLRTLNLKGCRCLRDLPAEFGFLQSLTEIIMPQNLQPFKLPETFGNLVSLSSFILDEHPGISQLPSSIGGLAKLTHLSLHGCVGIKELPCSVGEMELLVELDLSKSGITELPDFIGYLKKLKVMRVSYTIIRKLPHTIGNLEMLEELHAKKCWDLTDENLEEVGKLSHLRILDLSYTRISRFPMVLSSLSSLQTLELGSCHIQEVPDLPSSLTHLHIQACHFSFITNLSSLLNLDYLELSRLTVPIEELDPNSMSNLPEQQPICLLPSGLSTLKFGGISLLPPFSNFKNLLILCVIEYPMLRFSISQDLIHLRELKLSRCEFLVEIPGLSLLKNLQRLHLDRLERLVEIQGLSELESLLYFRISHCYSVERLPNLSKLDKLQHMELEDCQIRAINGVMGLESLKLDNRGCTVLERLMDGSRSTWLSRRVPAYDVFLSFRGPDTRYSIVDVLYKNLVRNKISVFRDDDEFNSGDGIPRELEIALDDSHIYVPFLSKNYASSHWCLDELACMVKSTSKSNGKKRILPIFYDVEISDVKLESNVYRRALNEHRSLFGNKMEEWEKALREVADIRGFDLKTNSLEEVVELVVAEVLSHPTNANAEFDRSLVEEQQYDTRRTENQLIRFPEVLRASQLLDVDSSKP